MRRICLLLVLTTAFFPFAGSGCQARKAEGDPREKPVTPAADQKPVQPAPVVPVAQPGPNEPRIEPKEDEDAGKRERYETALGDALNLLGEKKYPEALLALETAQTFHDTDFIKAEIAKLKTRIDQESAARRTLREIEAILENGQAKDAAQLADEALQQFGATDLAGRLVALKLQSDALLAAQKGQKEEDGGVRFQRLRDQGEAALKEKNLRAAALAFEQAVQAKEDARLMEQLQGIRTALERYDDLRRKAAELRRDPGQLEEALAALEEAAKNWDTLQVRQEIDEYALALQKRRDRVSVADFEVRGEVGFPMAGRTIAEEVLPHLKGRFDLVERGQLAKVLDELKLEGQLADNLPQQRELGQLAKIRYLVLGSVSPLGGITVNARLVDVRTGLVVQTGKVTAGTVEDLMPLLGDLAKQLLMSDDEKLAFELQRVQQVKRLPPPPAVDAPLPPPPEAPAAQELPPPPPIVIEAPPPAIGNFRLEQLEGLPPPPAIDAPPPPPAHGGAPEVQIKQRMLHAVLDLGDNHFRRGQFAEAQRQFQFALNLAPGHFDVRVRLDRVRPLLPPPAAPFVIVDPLPPPVVIVRPRIAVLNFVVAGDPLVVPPWLSTWTPHHLAPYFSPPFEVVDPAELYWYMGRTGMTVADLMHDPWARRWLGRALNVRYFVFGNVRQTASFDVTTYMVDAEYGFLQGTARIHVRHRFELKLRLEELARLTLMTPAQRAAYLAEAERFDNFLRLGLKHRNNRQFQLAIGVYEDALRVRPHHVEVLAHLAEVRRLHEQAAFEEARRREFARMQALAVEQQRRQWELARAAELARARAVPIEVVLLEEQRRQAQTILVNQARIALKIGNFGLSLNTFEGAVGLGGPRPAVGAGPDDLYLELARARTEAERRARVQAAQQQAAREAELHRLRELELERARKQLEDERLARMTREEALRNAQRQRDQGAYQAAFDRGQVLLNKSDFDGAIAAFQVARQVRKTEAVEALLNQAFVGQARAEAEKKGEQARLALERQLAEEKARREQAETEAKRNQDLYLASLKLAHKALADKNFTVAIAKYREAGKVYRTDAVLAGLRQAETAKAQAEAQAEAEQKKLIAEQQKNAQVKDFISQGQLALATKQYDKAAQSFTKAKSLAPDNVDVLAGLTKAELFRNRLQADLQRTSQEQERLKNFKRLLDNGQANLANKQYDAAVLALSEAVKLNPADATAKDALAAAQKAQAGAVTDAKAQEAARKKVEAFQKWLNDGRTALAGKRYDDAIAAFTAAQKVLPGDRTSADLLKDAQKARSDEAARVAAAAQQRAVEAQRAADLKKSLDQGRSALAVGNVDAAAKAFNAAAQLSPKNPDVLRALQDLGQAQKIAQAEADKQKKRQEQYRALVDAGKTALAAKRYEEAVNKFAGATALVPDDKSGLDLLRQAQKALTDERVAADLAAKRKFDQDKSERLRQYLATGQAALKAGNLDAAAKALAEARKIDPAAPALAKAQQDLDSAQRARADDLKKTQDLQKALTTSAQASLKAGNLDAAAKALADLVKLVGAADPGAVQLNRDIDTARKAEADRAAQAKQELLKVVSSGRTALQANKLDVAAQALAQASKLAPNDPAVLGLARDLDAARKQVDAEKTKLAQAEKLRQVLSGADAALKAGKLDEAAKAYADVLKLAPNDARAQAGLANVASARKTLAAESDKTKRFDDSVKSGQSALLAKKYDDAIKAFSDALKIRPADAKTAQLLAQAQKARAAQTTAIEAEAKRKTSFDLFMKEGNAAMAGKRFTDAQKAFREALKHYPSDLSAQRLLQQATTAADTPKTKQPLPPNLQAQFNEEMKSGGSLEKQGKFAEAMDAYQKAAKLIPGDAKAAAGAQKKADFCKRLGDGQKHLQVMRWLDAQREFEAALQLFPADPAATQLLQKAKQKKK